MTLRVFAPAKVNLHLAVGAASPDGYHRVETVLQALEFGDLVTIGAGGPSFLCEPDLGLPAAENLAWRAAMAMAQRFDRPLDIAIEVEKGIPSGAGLGGASADAAAVIVGLATFWSIERADVRLSVVARSLGADVPFFLEGGAALFGGRGDVLTRRLKSLDAPVVVVKPAEPVPTARAYEEFDRLAATEAVPVGGIARALESGDAAAVAAALYNNMTDSSVSLVPGIRDALEFVRASDAVLGAAMAGSGSAIFGICADDDSAEECAVRARLSGLWATATHAYPGGCTIEPSDG